MDYKTRHTLLHKLKDQHDERAWEEFYVIYRSYIFAVVMKKEISEADAEDIVQKVLLRAWKALPDFEYDEAKGKFRHWLARLTRNQTNDVIKAKYRQFDNSSTERHEMLKFSLAPWSEPEVMKIAELEWQKFMVESAWERVVPQLAEKVKTAYDMIREGCEAGEIAKKLEIEPNTVYVYKRRVEKLVVREVARLEAEWE